VKPVEMNELRTRMLNTREAVEGYNAADRELAMMALLKELREHANINKAELARRLNVTPSSITQLENNPGGVKISTLERYAAACGATINISVAYKSPSVTR